MLQVYCKNTKTSRKYPEGTSLAQMLEDFDFERPYPIVSAKVNNVSQGLKFKVYQNKDIEFMEAPHVFLLAATAVRKFRDKGFENSGLFHSVKGF